MIETHTSVNKDHDIPSCTYDITQMRFFLSAVCAALALGSGDAKLGQVRGLKLDMPVVGNNDLNAGGGGQCKCSIFTLCNFPMRLYSFVFMICASSYLT